MKAIMWQLKTPMQRAKRIEKTHASITLPATSRLKLETPSYIYQTPMIYFIIFPIDMLIFSYDIPYALYPVCE